MPALALHSFSKAIEIPPPLHNQPLHAWQTSARLTSLLTRFGIRVLGDLHGRKVVDFAWEKNCGPKTLYELDLLARRARFENGKPRKVGVRLDCAPVSRSCAASKNEPAIPAMREDAARFTIPHSVCHLALSELPISKRLANVVRSMGARNLGDFNGRSAFELLQYKACGWSMISEIQHLIERAILGEFDVAQIEEATAASDLLSLLDQGIAKLPLRERQFLLARIGLQAGKGSSSREDLIGLSYAEIGRQYGLTRARIHKVLVNTVENLRKTWGPQIPRLLEILKWRCLAAVCPLTPQLLAKWLASSVRCSSRRTMVDNSNDFHLSMQSYVRLIAALDNTIPCWPETDQRLRRTYHPVAQFDLTLARMIREGRGKITVAEAYRRFSHPEAGSYRRVTVEVFLRMLRSVEFTAVNFQDPEVPILTLSSLSPRGLRTDFPRQNGTSSVSAKAGADSRVVHSFDAKNGVTGRHAMAGH
jgi:hypothetical protein